MLEITQERAKTLEALLKENGFEDVADEMWITYHKNLGYLHNQLSCEHTYESVEEFAIKAYGKGLLLKDAMESGTVRPLYEKMACCQKCGKRYSDTKYDIKECIDNILNESHITISFGNTGDII